MREKCIQVPRIGFVYLVTVRLLRIREQLCPSHRPLETKVSRNLTKTWRVQMKKGKWSWTMLPSHRNGSLYGKHREVDFPSSATWPQEFKHTGADWDTLSSFTAVLHSWGLSQTCWIKTAGLNSLFPQQNVYSKQVNERTHKSAALGAQTGNAFFT